ncbi:solute carrier family 13 (sodium-dependent dicarboxylate transporter), member 2/3/5 [Halomonas shengliensis]|uniref:Solute carrier family 13 (Sodium-dependent dicarboxylate transporter), member 2/3/5 n=1 Tax=Halomonas shengliensis TaxID=419597 RepID=A0A1H0MTG3_9GAMM|nr:SLC13 family permease [Halomonas shengliensis]SDO83420.1 solute carrier family 13 (sodium-dependent dicarboxylate transporter), member 2/3/5 [Halomonas shengliensis]
MTTETESPSRLARLKVPLGLLLGPLLAGLVLVSPAPEGLPVAAWQVVALTAWMAAWWVLEPVPIAVTALLPLVLLPLLEVAPIEAVAAPYANPLIFLFLGGFLLAEAIQRWGLHRRIAMLVLRVAGRRPDHLVAGFMVATAGLSMWVSNTATAALMVPIGLSVLEMLKRQGGEGASHHLALTLLLGIALGANIGGMGTLIGTPPNALLAGFMADSYGIEIGFAEWMAVALPPALLLLALAWWLLTRRIYPLGRKPLPGVAAMLEEQARDLGRMTDPERRVATIFVLVALAWVFRPLLEAWLGVALSDAGIAVTAAVLLFVVPARWAQRQFLMDWEAAAQLPWGVLIMVGGGLSLGAAIESSGLAAAVAEGLAVFGRWPTWGLVAAVALVVMAMSHVTSNTATAAAILPLTASLTVSLGHSPLLLSVPVALAASCAFMLPVATPPNAVVFASGQLSVAEMVRAGALVSLAALAVIVAVVFALAMPLLGFGWAL